MKRSFLTMLFALLALLGVSATNPLIPMTAITGKPDRNAVRQMLLRYHEVGIEQFLIYPRSGLEIEYMSEEWMGFCRNCFELADSLGMKVWLYDEYNWPSGSCKGQVTADGHDDCYPNVLMFNRQQNGEYEVKVVKNHVGSDILNPDAVARFIALTHERYYSEFKEYFGKVVPAIFTDEPSFSYSISNSKGILEANFAGFDNNHFPLTWYDGLEADYKAHSGGRDLHGDVIAYLKGEPSAELWTNYYSVVGDRMRSVYIKALADWCEGHGIALTGHLMYEKVYKSVRCNGNPMKSLSLFGIPGFDEANSDLAIAAREMEVSGLSLAHYASQGKAGAMCEMYAVGPADLTMSHMRQLMWMCSAFGINNYIVAVAAMDARGNRDKGDWYFSSGPTQPWFDYYREFGAEAKLAAEFARKPFSPKVRVRVPFSYFMSLDKTPAFEQRGVRYLRFLEALLSWQLQYMFLDEDEPAPAGQPVLCYDAAGFYVEGETEHFDNLEEYMTHVAQIAPREVVVLGPDGKETRDVLVRRWDDESLILVDLTDNDANDRLLTVCTKGGASGKVRLLGHGAFAGSLADMHALAPRAGKPLRLRNIKLAVPGPNTVRCLYTKDNPSFEFSASDDIEGVRLLLRRDVDAVEVLLDGKPVRAELPAEGLPEGFHQLYRQSEPLIISKGLHKLEVVNGYADYRYLPSAFLAGNFSCADGHLLVPGLTGTDPMAMIPGYAGTYEIEAEISVPSGKGRVLALDTNLACTEVLIDGQPLGRKGWGPYEWQISDSIKRGRHNLTVRISTSVMPLFGNIQLLDQDQPYAGWLRIRPGQHGDKSRTGIFRAQIRQDN